MASNRQVGTVINIRKKKAVVQVGSIPITMNIDDLIVVKDKVAP